MLRFGLIYAFTSYNKLFEKYALSKKYLIVGHSIDLLR